jgi:hypothetical protein
VLPPLAAATAQVLGGSNAIAPNLAAIRRGIVRALAQPITFVRE